MGAYERGLREAAAGGGHRGSRNTIEIASSGSTSFQQCTVAYSASARSGYEEESGGQANTGVEPVQMPGSLKQPYSVSEANFFRTTALPANVDGQQLCDPTQAPAVVIFPLSTAMPGHAGSSANQRTSSVGFVMLALAHSLDMV